ncbi:MAG: class I SAM-dependent methyltransferase, partial [Bacteroidota bacterium]
AGRGCGVRLTNEWNRFVYRLWAPVYDQTVNRFFMPGRRRAMQVLDLRPGERVLIVGIGTGADLPLLPDGVAGTAIDLSPEMLVKARRRAERRGLSLELIEGDAQAPLVEDSAYDAAVLNLILSVIPDGNACLRATLCALKVGGRAVIFDKFLPEGARPSAGRKLANVFSTILGTDINRRLSDITRDCSCEVMFDEPSIGRGLYRVVLIRKTGNALC